MQNENEGSIAGDSGQAVMTFWRYRTIIILWIVYAGHYLCRVNLAAAQKQLAVQQGLTKGQLGVLVSLLKLFYAVGQVINGALADAIGPKAILVVGLTASALLNMVFAHLRQFSSMAAAWAANGYLQSGGWAAVVRTIANWFPAGSRDTASGLIATSYIAGSALSWMLAGAVTASYGWRYAFWIPAWLCIVIVIAAVWLIKVRPTSAGVRPAASDNGEVSEGDEGSATSWLVLRRRPALWVLGLATMAMMFGHHGLLDWTPHYLAESRFLGPSAAARVAALLPVGATVGCLVLAWFSRSRRYTFSNARLIRVSLIVWAALVAAFPFVAEMNMTISGAFLGIIGLVSAPPTSLMVCALPANIATRANAGIASGFVGTCGYLGAALSGWSSGRLMRYASRIWSRNTAWSIAWRLWSVGLALAAVVMTGHREGDGAEA